MSTQTYEAKLTDSEPVSVEYDFGDNLQEAVTLFGEEVVYSRAKAAAVIDLQAFMRSKLRAGKSEQEIRDAVLEWKPGIRQVSGKSKEEKAREYLQKLSPEERMAILEEFTSSEDETAA